MNEMKTTTEDIVLQWFQTVSRDLAKKWSSILDYDEILREAYLLYSLKPDKWKQEYEANPDSFRSYSYTVINNYLTKNKAPEETKYMRHNYSCDEGMMDEVLSGRLRLNSIYQPNILELREDIRNILEEAAPAYIVDAWHKITTPQRRLLQNFAERDDAITRAERKASEKFIMRVDYR